MDFNMLILKIYYHLVAIIKKIFYKIIYGKHIKFGKNVTFRKGFSLMIDKNSYVEIGEGSFFNNYCTISAMSNIKIGKHCMFGENVKIYDQNHVFKNIGTLVKDQGYKTGDIEIKDNCWIGNNSIILKNTTIGKNSVISAGVVVSNENIEEGSILKLNHNYKIERINNEKSESICNYGNI